MILFKAGISVIRKIIFLVSILFLCSCQSQPKAETLRTSPDCRAQSNNVLIVGHRGAPGYVPEHTLRSYELAVDLGADFIEPDLVITKDRVLVARHENEISETTDVAEKFPDRKTTKIVDGEKKEGWFVEDFTLNEIKKLKAKERLKSRSQAENGLHQIPTFEEVVQFLLQKQKKTNRAIGIVPEIKHSTYFTHLHFDLEKELVRILKKYHLNSKDSKVMIQSFEISNLKRLQKMTPVALVQLIGAPQEKPADQSNKNSISYAEMVTDVGLQEIKKYANWISPAKAYIVQIDKNQKMIESDFVIRSHRAGLLVVPYTFRSDKEFLPSIYKSENKKEYLQFYKLNIDAVFSDFSDHAFAARKEFEAWPLCSSMAQ